MIIYLIIVLLILMILAWTFLPKTSLRIIFGSLLTVALTGAIGVLTMTFTRHYGMHKVSRVRTEQIYSAAGDKSPAGMLIVSKLGRDDHQHLVMVYQDTLHSKAKAHFVPKMKHIDKSIKQESYYELANVNNATVTTKITRWQWKSNNAKRWLNVGQAGELVKQVHTVKIPKKSWIVISPKQMQQIQKINKRAAETDSAAMAQLAKLPKDKQAEMTVQMLKQQLK